MLMGLLLLLVWNAALVLLAWGAPDRLRPALRWCLPPAVMLLPLDTPGERLAVMSLFLLFALKGTVLLGRARSSLQKMDKLGLLFYLTLWPGMDPAPLERRQKEIAFPARWFVQGWVTMICSAVAIGALAFAGRLTTWPLLVLVLCFVHLGYSDVLNALMRLAGFPVARLFENPLASQGLRDFWSHRWNRPFVEMNQVLFLPILQPVLRRRAVLGAFLVSGFLHELALSFPALRGWGGPFAYFLLQGLLMQLEGPCFRGLPGWVRRFWTWGWIFLPLPLVFRPGFQQAILVPLAQAISSLPIFDSRLALLRFLLTLAGCGHFLVLCAGAQVPWRLGWREELSRLRPLNRKLLWGYYGYIASFIVTFGIVILRLREEMLAGERGASTLLFIIATFWTGRILIDAIVFEHDDWPSGTTFVIGHTLLTSLFVFISISAWLVLWT